MRRRNLSLILIGALCFCRLSGLTSCTIAADAPKPEKTGTLPHVTFDVKKHQVRVECEALAVEAPLEFFCCRNNSNEHESVLRSPVLPSDMHTALLAIGLQPGKPVTYSEALKKWFPPQGPPMHISCEWQDKAGKIVSLPAYRMMRDTRTKKPMPALNWVFAGSRVMPDGKYAADGTGYLVSVVNFDLTVIDIPDIASNANEALEWERNPETSPPKGAKVTMVIEPAGNAKAGDAIGAAPEKPSGEKSAPAQETAARVPAAAENGDKTEGGDGALSDVRADEKRMTELHAYWLKSVRPHEAALKEAAQAHYEVLKKLRQEQQRLIDEADRIQRAIDELEKDYQDMTTPHPAEDK